MPSAQSMKTYLILTSQTKHLAKSVLKKTGDFKIVPLDLNRDKKRLFPDGEIYMKIQRAKKLKGKKVVVLHSGAPKPNEGLVELELILQILRDNDVKSEVFFTYCPYAMQGKVFEKGETNVAENLIEKLVNFYGVKKIYIIDAHFFPRKWIKKYPLVNISAVPILIEKAGKDFSKNILFFSPDIGGVKRTKISGFRKKRLDSFRVEMFSPKLNLKGKIVAAVDDMIKTGGTLLKFYEITKKAGAKKVLALVTHGVIPPGVSKIKKKYSKLYLTNTVKQNESNVDITNLILENISQI